MMLYGRLDSNLLIKRLRFGVGRGHSCGVVKKGAIRSRSTGGSCGCIMGGDYVMEMLNLIRGCPARARRPNEAIPADFARPAVARLRQTQMRGEVRGATRCGE